MKKVKIIFTILALLSLSLACSEETKLPPELVVLAPDTARVNTPVVFDATQSKDKDGNIDESTFSFDFGDSTAQVTGAAKVTHTYTKTGDFKVTVKCTDNDKLESTKVVMISIKDNLSPVAVLASPEKGRINTYITFDGSGSSDPDGRIVSYAFDFGDGSEKVSGTAVAVYKFSKTGIFSVTLEVTDNEGSKSSIVKQIEIVDNLPPVATFALPQISTEGEIITADASSSTDADGKIVKYEFDFGDNSAVQEGMVVNHVFATAGNYKVTLKVTDNEGAESTLTKEITINSLVSQSEPPEAIFTAPDRGIVNSPITFDATSSKSGSGKITEYKWEFSDGSQEVKGTESIITHTFTNTGVYKISLTITSLLKDGKSTLTDKTSREILITEEGIAVEKIEPDSGPATGYTEVLITGKNFNEKAYMNIYFGSYSAVSVNVIDSTRIKVVTPKSSPGKVDVLIQNGDNSVLLNEAFTYFGADNYADTIFCPQALVSGGNSLGVKSTDDDAMYSISLPFDFEFYGILYPAGSKLYISTNGFLSFDNVSSNFMHSPIPSSNNPPTLIAPFFMDMKPGSAGQIYTDTSGTAPNRKFAISYRKFTSNAAPNDEYNFEVILYESSNDIKFQYLNNFDGTYTDGTQALIGIQDINRGGLQVSRNTSIRGIAPGGRTYVLKYDRDSYTLYSDTTLTIYSHQPANNGDVGIQGNFTIDFTKELNSNSLNNITMVDLSNNNASVALNLTLSNDKRRVTGTSQNPLVVDHKYRVTISSNLTGMNNAIFSYDPTKVACNQTNSPTSYSFDFTARAALSQVINLGGGSQPMQVKHAKNSSFAFIAKSNGNRLETLNTNALNIYNNLSLQDCNNPSYLVLSTDDMIGYISCPNNRVAVVNLDIQNIHQIDVNNTVPGTQSINVGNSPAGIDIRGTNDRVYVANYNGDSVSVIDTSNYQVITNINVGDSPIGAKVHNQKNLLYITNRFSNNISVIDINSGSPTENTVIDTIALNNCEEPYMMELLPDGSRLFVTCNKNDRVVVIDTSSLNQVASIDVEDSPVGIDITFDGKLAYVANYNANSISIINIGNLSVSQTIDLQGNPRPFFVVFIPNTYTALVTYYNTDQVAVIK